MSERESLKPCPFCGSEKVTTYFVRDGRGVGCGCGVSLVRFNGPGDTDAKVRRAWNTRARPESSNVSERERIARLCCYWADPVKNGTCHDNFCTTECRAIRPDDQFWQMADAILARPEPSEAVVEGVAQALDEWTHRALETHGRFDTRELSRTAIAAYEGERGK